MLNHKRLFAIHAHLVAAVVLSGCAANQRADHTGRDNKYPASTQSATDARPPVVTSLKGSLDPLIEHFNANRGKPRLIALVSPTCPVCVYGAKAVKESVIEAFPDTNLSISIVWIDMLRSDDDEAADISALIFSDPRVRQFHDPRPKKLAGWAIAHDLLFEGGGPAWDIYLFYDSDSQWIEHPPTPVEWMHQLGGDQRADPARFTPGEKLDAALRSAAAAVVPHN